MRALVTLAAPLTVLLFAGQALAGIAGLSHASQDCVGVERCLGGAGAVTAHEIPLGQGLLHGAGCDDGCNNNGDGQAHHVPPFSRDS